jgi:methionyl-tRNA formyltransferase
MQKLKISILIDNPRSWFVPHGQNLERQLRERGHGATVIENPHEIPKGDITFFLSCEQIIKRDVRDRNKYNLVIHASALPQGKGWSPTTWKILEGENEIPLTLFEAVDKVDAGDIYATSSILLDGHELIDEVREKEGKAIVDLALRFVDTHQDIVARPQEGEESFYPRRKPEHSELDPNKTLVEIFDQLRVADNERYPAFFTHRGHTYILKIHKKDNEK